MTMHVKVGGVWKEVSAPSVKVGGAWKTVTGGWVKVSGAWKKFYDYLTADAIAVDVSDFDGFGGPVDALFEYRNTGGVYQSYGGGAPTLVGTWLTVGSASDFEVNWNPTGDTAENEGDPLNTWLNLGTTRAWALGLGSSGMEILSGTLSIRRASDQVVVDTATCTIQIESTL